MVGVWIEYQEKKLTKKVIFFNKYLKEMKELVDID